MTSTCNLIAVIRWHYEARSENGVCVRVVACRGTVIDKWVHENSDGVRRMHAAILYGPFCQFVEAEPSEAHRYVPRSNPAAHLLTPEGGDG